MPFTIEVTSQTAIIILSVAALILMGVSFWQDRNFNEQEIADITALAAVIKDSIPVAATSNSTTVTTTPTAITTTTTVTTTKDPDPATTEDFLWVHPAARNQLLLQTKTKG